MNKETIYLNDSDAAEKASKYTKKKLLSEIRAEIASYSTLSVEQTKYLLKFLDELDTK